jgi:hypothetical protein
MNGVSKKIKGIYIPLIEVNHKAVNIHTQVIVHMRLQQM